MVSVDLDTTGGHMKGRYCLMLTRKGEQRFLWFISRRNAETFATMSSGQGYASRIDFVAGASYEAVDA